MTNQILLTIAAMAFNLGPAEAARSHRCLDGGGATLEITETDGPSNRIGTPYLVTMKSATSTSTLKAYLTSAGSGIEYYRISDFNYSGKLTVTTTLKQGHCRARICPDRLFIKANLELNGNETQYTCLN